MLESFLRRRRPSTRSCFNCSKHSSCRWTRESCSIEKPHLICGGARRSLIISQHESRNSMMSFTRSQTRELSWNACIPKKAQRALNCNSLSRIKCKRRTRACKISRNSLLETLFNRVIFKVFLRTRRPNTRSCFNLS